MAQSAPGLNRLEKGAAAHGGSPSSPFSFSLSACGEGVATPAKAGAKPGEGQCDIPPSCPSPWPSPRWRGEGDGLHLATATIRT